MTHAPSYQHFFTVQSQNPQLEAFKLDHFLVRYRAEGKQIEEIEKSTARLLETRPSGQI